MTGWYILGSLYVLHLGCFDPWGRCEGEVQGRCREIPGGQRGGGDLLRSFHNGMGMGRRKYDEGPKGKEGGEGTKTRELL